MMWGYYHFRKHPYVETFFFGGEGGRFFLGGENSGCLVAGREDCLPGLSTVTWQFLLNPGGTTREEEATTQKGNTKNWSFLGKNHVFWYRFFAQVWWLFLSLTHVCWKVELQLQDECLSVLFSLFWYLSGQWCWQDKWKTSKFRTGSQGWNSLARKSTDVNRWLMVCMIGNPLKYRVWKITGLGS